jgi:hypothetical protein
MPADLPVVRLYSDHHSSSRIFGNSILPGEVVSTLFKALDREVLSPDGILHFVESKLRMSD